MTNTVGKRLTQSRISNAIRNSMKGSKEEWILASQKANKPFRNAAIIHSGSFKPSYLREPVETNRKENPNLIRKRSEIGKPPQSSDGLL